ncbi:MAG TPA: hypothetical protein VJI46_04075 [Candidatus Nanoarchaeia archaeon]|nr:hypothetical protein [Candidatus Nanoarchaeia archaeon]
MKPFDYYLEIGEVKKAAPDLALAKSLVRDMNSRIKDSKSLLTQNYPKIVFENVYDALRDFADAVLAIEGYKSYSHQASFAYLAKFNFNIQMLETLDRFRYKRNGSKYYGQTVSVEEAKEILDFHNGIIKKIDRIIKEKGLSP